MPPSADAELACRRHNRLFAAVSGAILLGTTVVNLAVDPFRVYHDAWPRPYARHDRSLVPGLIRNVRYEYDAITVGTSHSANFRPEVMDAELGWKTLRCTLDGSSTAEQLRVVRVAVEAGRARRVLWGLDHFAAQEATGRPADPGKMPSHLYERSWRTPLLHFVSSETLRESARVLQGRGAIDLAKRGGWFDEQADRFGKGRALDTFAGWVDFKVKAADHVVPETQDRNVAAIIDIVRRHPEIEFVCLFPPVSVLCSVADHRDGGAIFAERLRFRQALCDGLADLPNCRLYDFETAARITHDFDLYKDPSHYNQDVNDWMIREIAADRGRVSRDTFAANQAEFARQARTFLVRVCDPRHPDHERLCIGRLGIDRAILDDATARTALGRSDSDETATK